MPTREAWFLVAAVALHTTIPLVARIAPQPQRVMVARSSGAYAEVEVELDPEVLRPRPPRAEEPRPEETREQVEEQDRTRRRAPGPRTSEVEAPAPEEPVIEGPAEPGPAPEPAPAPTDEYGGPPPPEPIVGVPGVGGSPVWTLPGVLPRAEPSPAAPTAAPRRPDTPTDKAGQVLRQAMRAKDKSLGLDLPAAGTVASAVVEAVRAADTPTTARATFEVRLSGTGQVLGARLVSATAGGADLWARVSSAAVARLAGRSLRMTAAFAKGARVYVSVSSSVRMPSGAASSGPQMQGAGFGFDLSDIGAHASRVISSSFKVVAVE